jgi:2-hydroxychromene-2-carboxylate isomerase
VTVLRVHFDFISPYAYLAWTQLPALAARHGRELEPVPVLFAGLLEHHGTLGPAEVPAKRRYVLFDIARKARALGVPLELPVHHPFNPLLALRLASLPLEPAARRALIDRLFAAVWSGRAENIQDPVVVAAILRELGHDPERTLAEATSPAGKARLKAQTDRAIADGIFGVPSVLADGELFWGVDALPLLDAFLGGAAPSVDPGLEARWAAMTPSATRPGAR